MKELYVVTGGAGFVGSHTVDSLVADGKQVVVLDKKSWAEAVNLHHLKDKIDYMQADITDYEAVIGTIADATHVLHLAALVSVPESINRPIEAHMTNVLGTMNVFLAAVQANVEKVVYASSAAVYGETKSLPISETDPIVPCSPYALHKYENELYATYLSQAHNIPFVGLRYFNIFGTRQDPSSPYSGVISIFTHCVKEGVTPTIFGDGSQTRDFVHVSDVAAANVRALGSTQTTTKHAVYNIGTGAETSLTTLLTTLASIAGRDIIPVHEAVRAGDIEHSCAKIDCAKNELGYTPRCSLREGLRELLDT